MFKKILVPVDLADPDLFAEAVKVATEMARLHGATLRLVTVIAPVQPSVAHLLPPGTHERILGETNAKLEKLASECGLGENASAITKEGSVYHEVLDEAAASGADLIVMGSHRPEMSTYLLGSNAARIVRHAPCSVMVLR